MFRPQIAATSLILILFSFGAYLLFQDFRALLHQEKGALLTSHKSASLLLPIPTLEAALATKDSQSSADSQLLALLKEIQSELDLQGALHVVRKEGKQLQIVVSSHPTRHKGEFLDIAALPQDSLIEGVRGVTDLYSADSRRWMAAYGPLPLPDSIPLFLILEADKTAFFFQLLTFFFHYLFLGAGLILIGIVAFSKFNSSSQRRHQQMKEVYSTLFHDSADAVLLLDGHGKIVQANESAKSLFHWEKEDVTEKNFCLPTDNQFSYVILESNKSVLKSTLEGGERFRAKAKIVFKDERVRYVTFSSTPLPHAEGALLVIQDITHDVMREQELLHVQHRLKEQNALLQKQMIADPLTETLNKQYLYHILEPKNLKWLSAERTSMLVIDVDDFKSINDTKGHMTGDQTLKAFGLFLKNFFRRSDKVVRYGGDEFVVILPGTSLAEATRIAQNLIDALRKAQFGENIRLTASVGVAQLTENESGKDWMERADAAMYDAKKSGKNAYRVLEAESLEILN